MPVFAPGINPPFSHPILDGSLERRLGSRGGADSDVDAADKESIEANEANDLVLPMTETFMRVGSSAGLRKSMSEGNIAGMGGIGASARSMFGQAPSLSSLAKSYQPPMGFGGKPTGVRGILDIVCQPGSEGIPGSAGDGGMGVELEPWRGAQHHVPSHMYGGGGLGRSEDGMGGHGPGLDSGGTSGSTSGEGSEERDPLGADSMMRRRALSTGDLLSLAAGGGAYNKEERLTRINRFRQKRLERNYNKKIKYEYRKQLADQRPRVRGRFAKSSSLEESKSGESGSDPSAGEVSAAGEPGDEGAGQDEVHGPARPAGMGSQAAKGSG